MTLRRAKRDPLDTYNNAVKAFERDHLYPHDPSLFEHQQWVLGWIRGCIAGIRAGRRSRRLKP